MYRTPSIYLLAAIAALYALPTFAEDAAKPEAPTTLIEAVTMGKSMTNFRLRYENVDQDGKADQSNAWTMRSLIGWQTKPFNNFSIAAQLINVAQFNNNFYDGTPNTFGLTASTPANKGNYPLVVDPDYTGVNQLFLEWSGLPNTKVRVGRQSVKLDNVRFVGNVEYRQIMQVFDGIAIENKSIRDVEIYAAHFGMLLQNFGELLRVVLVHRLLHCLFQRRCCCLCHLISLCLEADDGFVNGCNGLNTNQLAFLHGVFNYRPVHFILYGRVRIRIKQGLDAPFITNACSNVHGRFARRIW